jgi:hypothetical protein
MSVGYRQPLMNLYENQFQARIFEQTGLWKFRLPKMERALYELVCQMELIAP